MEVGSSSLPGTTSVRVYRPFGGLAQLARALAWHARGHRFDPDILHESLFGIEIFDILTHKTVVLNQKIRYFTSENQSLRVLRHSQTYVAIIQ